MNLNLTPEQNKIIAAGITTLAAMVVVAAVVVVIFYSALFFKSFSHVFLPLAVALPDFMHGGGVVQRPGFANCIR